MKRLGTALFSFSAFFALSFVTTSYAESPDIGHVATTNIAGHILETNNGCCWVRYFGHWYCVPC